MCKIYETSWEELHVSFLIELQNLLENKLQCKILTDINFSDYYKYEQSIEKFHIDFCILYFSNNPFLEYQSFRYSKEGAFMLL